MNMLTGAREGVAGGLRQVVAAAMARDLCAFVVPGADVARARGLDLDATGLHRADTPRQANVLLVAGPLPPALLDAACVAWAQMPRPRAILALGAGKIAPLPGPDAAADLSLDGLAAGLAALRRAIAAGAFMPEVTDFDAPALAVRLEYTCPMHPEVVSDKPGSCPKCGMDLVPKDQAGGHAGADETGGGDHRGHEGPSEYGGHGSELEIPGIEPHFMSMVDMTRDMPASPDGLRMEWIEVPFGPFFVGMPGGLGLTLTLDGDSVAASRAESLVPGALAPGFPAVELADRLAAQGPLAPAALRELACRALEAATGVAPLPERGTARAAALERARIASHLNWLAGLARQAGLVALERRIGALHQRLRRADAADCARAAPALRALGARVRRTPLLRDRLAGVGQIKDRSVAEAGGPVARAAGYAVDARADDPAYATLNFKVIAGKDTGTGGDAWTRLCQRLAEIDQSLDLIARAGAIAEAASAADLQTNLPADGHAMARVETPRGPATLHLTLRGGSIAEARLTTPFSRLAALVGPMVVQMELAEALTAVASLDLDPWGARP